MSEAFVDLHYRGLPLGSGIRLSKVDASHLYLELPAPMPVGTMISVQSHGQPITARVVEVFEQIAGSERAPGMRVLVLDGYDKVAAADGAPSPVGQVQIDDEVSISIERSPGESSPGMSAAAALSSSDVVAVQDDDVSDADNTNEQPDSPASAADSSPRGRKRRRSSRR
jgi:hypothetical protein